MTTLKKICSSLYRVKDEKHFIQQCINDPENKKLNQEVLKQIDDKCTILTPLTLARECAFELGLSPGLETEQTTKKIEGAAKPLGILIDATSPRKQCEERCNTPFINGDIDEEEWDACFEKCWLDADTIERIDRNEKIEARKKTREKELKSLTPWGRFAFQIGLDLERRSIKFNDVFSKWNETNPGRESDDGTIERGWRPGTRIALTTGPGLTRFAQSNAFMQMTLVDLRLYESTERMVHVNAETRSLNSYDNTALELLDFKFYFPLFRSNFFELGFSYFHEDLLLGKQDNLFFVIPGSAFVGMDYQFIGTPVTISDRALDSVGAEHFLSNYAMFGVRAEVSRNDLYSDYKGAEFCNQVSDSCAEGPKSHDDRTEPAPMDFFTNEEPNASFHISSHIFGESRGSSLGMIYRVYTDYNPTWKKVESGGTLAFQVELGEAMELEVSGRGSKLWSLEEDNNLPLPDDGFELGTLLSVRWKPFGNL